MKSSLRRFYGGHHDFINGYRVSVTHANGNVCMSLSQLKSFPHLCLITGFLIRVTKQVPLVEQELLTFPEHRSSSQVLCSVIFSFLCVVLCRHNMSWSFWPFVLFLLTIALSVLWFTVSDYLCGILTHFLIFFWESF
jgi:hypothetical protein